MATPSQSAALSAQDYPDSDGRPVGETPRHVENLTYLLHMLRIRYTRDPQVYLAGNMFVYVPGDRFRNVAPDLFVVFGIPKSTTPERRRYLVWEEGKAPDVVIELTSESTREEDIDDKIVIYRNQGVREYFLYDPYEEYLDSPLQGYRLIEGEYQPIEAVAGRLPSSLLGLHLKPSDGLLRLYDPATNTWLSTPEEDYHALLAAETARQQAEAARQQAEAARQQAEAARQQEEEARRRAETEMQRLRQELEEMRRRLPPQQP
jgi:Uma2 family endonuclease